MLKADIIMKGNTMLNQVMLFKNKNLGESQILTESEAIKYLHDNKTIFFCGKYVQGGLIPNQILSYRLYNDEEGELDKKIKDYVYDSVWHKREEIAEFITKHKHKLSEILN